MDGGVADNLPLHPLLAFERCDEVVVILANRRASAATGNEREMELTQELISNWTEVDRCLRLQACHAQYGSTYPGDVGKYRRNDPPQVVPYGQPECRPRLKFIEPISDMGNFFTGTINWKRSFTVRKSARDGISPVNYSDRRSGPTSAVYLTRRRHEAFALHKK